MAFIRFFDTLHLSDIALVGGKNASLGEMISTLSSKGINVPHGFATTADAYRFFVEHNELRPIIEKELQHLDINDVKSLQSAGAAVRELFLYSEMPSQLVQDIQIAYAQLSDRYDTTDISVAVRSSGTAEDLPDASFAGQQESYLNIQGAHKVIESVQHCFASLFTDRAISYRQSRGYDHFQVALSVGVQKMVRSDSASSGIMFTIDTESGSDKLIMINSTWGLGENIVGGHVNPDEFYLFKPTLKENYNPIIKRSLGSKRQTMIYTEDINHPTKNIETPLEQQARFSISDEEATQLGRFGLTIEEHYTQIANAYRPMDIEWAKDGDDGKLYIVQARPETVRSKELNSTLHQLKTYTLNNPDATPPLLQGKAVGERIGSGKVHIIKDITHAAAFQAGEVLVADITDPDWEPIMKKASAVITNRGGRTCHAAIVAREIGVPTIVGTGNATKILQDVEEVTVSCAQGEEGYIYKGALDFSVDVIDLDTIATTQTHLYMNIANPDIAFQLAKLPNDGVGLARMEFIINSAIKAHPMALYYLSENQTVEDQEAISELMKGYNSPKSFFVDTLASGIGMIAAAFYPKPVIVRTSDFKSNEYINMLGGSSFEQKEENPMLGFRGASRYISSEYRHAFEWECEALKRVRDTMGLTNLKVMLPFVRTPDEGKKVIDIMATQGLVQGVNGLQIYAMCEIPSNVLLAEEFLDIFDGYSIGSNDLTQLTLGVDRDSELTADIFDERNPAVLTMIRMAINAAKTKGKYIGICGQAPSDYPEITKFLVEHKIDSISLNPDSLLKMRALVSEIER